MGEMFGKKLNSNGGYCKKCGGISTWGILAFRMGDFECSPLGIYVCNLETIRLLPCWGAHYED